jgi:hypothetical protein
MHLDDVGQRVPRRLQDPADVRQRLAGLRAAAALDETAEPGDANHRGLKDTYLDAIEHVEVLVAEPKRMLDRLRHYGSMFIGEQTTVAYGDKVSGPNHVLPTLRAARFTGGLWVGKYLKTVTFQHMDEDASVEMARHCEVESLAEGMEAPARTATIRLERYAEQAGSRAASAASPTS